jgi:MEDS: MEthanogen/methylotroph, DcmR Sensory domain
LDPVHRHRCLIYDGAPSRYLPGLAAVMREQLRAGTRCLYLNSPTMVSGMRSYLAAAGVDVAHEVAKGSLIVSSDRPHLTGTRFDIGRMIAQLEDAISQALNEGYRGLWATGDMAWELGPEQNFNQLLEYEWRLEEVFLRRSSLSGICQYHKDTLPKQAVRDGLATHASIFINETLSRINPYYAHNQSFKALPVSDGELDGVVAGLSRAEG